MSDKARQKKPRNGSTVSVAASDDDVDQRLAKTEGQVIGIRKMRRMKRDCVDILTQVAAAQAALDQVKIVLLTTHLSDCTKGGGCLPSSEVEAMTEDEYRKETRDALRRFVK